ncbi:MAG: EF-P beta-lysylation protein EpmB [Planctomycetes bacterium]|nr:EF-P beta-lysylation protein EpmB [Planctomycetota bacterium]
MTEPGPVHVSTGDTMTAVRQTEQWQRDLSDAIRDPAELVERLQLPAEFVEPAIRAARGFPLVVPESYLRRIEPGNSADPLLLQVLPVIDEEIPTPDFQFDALQEADSRLAPGLLQKYAGRALMIVTGVCAVHCRYCFRRHYPYETEPRRLDEWGPALAAITADVSLREVLLSGGDPLTLSDRRLSILCERLDSIPHLTRLRIHTRLPIVLPSRVTEELIAMLTSLRLRPIIVVHANSPREIAGDCADALRRLVQSGMTVLNQSVLLRRINDNADALTELCERLIDLGVLPYYLHQLDRVQGTAHFEVAESRGREIIRELRRRLPGYAVPRYVREIPGEPYKVPLPDVV